MNIPQIISKSVQEYNELHDKISDFTKKVYRRYTIEDYDYLDRYKQDFGKFHIPYFLTYVTLYEAENRVKEGHERSIWYWEKDLDKKKSETFLSAQSVLLNDLLRAYVSLMKTQEFLPALILFRSYIEYSSQFYACLLDYEFYKKYTENEVLDEDYRKHWFKNLTPEKVISRLRSLNLEIKKQDKRLGMGTYDQRRRISPFDSSFREMLYTRLSGISHGGYPSLMQNDEDHLYSLVFLCSDYLVQTNSLIDAAADHYINRTEGELFKQITTTNIWVACRAYKGKSEIIV